MSEKEKNEKTFHQVASELIGHEVIVVTRQRNFEGRLLSVGTDVLVLQNQRYGGHHVKLFIRIEEVIAIYRAEQRTVGPFGFMPMGENFQESGEKHESN